MKIRIDLFLKIFILAVVVSVFASSCQRRPSGVLNTVEMENLLFDMHVMEGAMSANGADYNNPQMKEKYFQALLKKYDVTPVQFDSSVSWYTKHPKFFERIYVNIDARLKKMTADVDHRKYHPIDSNATTDVNIWNLKSKYILTKDSARTKLKFDVKSNGFMAGDYYLLSLLHRLS